MPNMAPLAAVRPSDAAVLGAAARLDSAAAGAGAGCSPITDVAGGQYCARYSGKGRMCVARLQTWPGLHERRHASPGLPLYDAGQGQPN